MPILLIIMLICSDIYAGIDGLMEFVQQPGSMHNTTAPKIVKDQQGGYLSGGSVLLRGPRPKELTPITIQTPKLKYDACTGSGDFRFGAMSYISGEEFSRFLKNVSRASGAYLVKMSIKTACPQCEDIMTYLETVARDINNFTLNQCSMAQVIASGAFSKLVSSEKQQCMMNANIAGGNNDMFETSAKCQAEAGYAHPVNSKDSMPNQFNLVWAALSKGSISDSNFKELMMSVSGTILVKKEDGRYVFRYLPSLVTDKDFLKKYVGADLANSNIELYSCDSKEKCLNPEIRKISLARSKTIYGNISRILLSITDKVKKDNKGFTDEEEALIAFSSLPILSLIEVELASKTDGADMLVRVGEFIDAVCLDIITNYLQIITSSIIVGLKNLKYAQIDDAIIENFTRNCEYVRKYLANEKFMALKKLQLIMQVKERIENQNKEFEYRFAKFLTDIDR